MEKDRIRKMSIRSSRRSSAMNITRQPIGMCKADYRGLKMTVLWVSYLLLGSAIFIYLEKTHETVYAHTDHHHWARFKELVSAGDVVEELLLIKDNLVKLCNHTLFNHTIDLLDNDTIVDDPRSQTSDTLVTILQKSNNDLWKEVEEECKGSLTIIKEVIEIKSWSLVDAIYYTMTLIATIGYGHIVPITPSGRRFCVLYSLFGVPLTCILLAMSSDMISNRMLQFYTTAKKRHLKHQTALLYGIILMYLMLGVIVFMIVPSVVLSKLEDWTYEDSLYYTFITLTTIGFGDLIAGYNEDIQHQDLYKLVIVVWIMLALGYWFLLHSFLQKVFRNDVPQIIRKSLRRSLKIKRQPEFFRQLLGKVVTEREWTGQQRTEPGTDTGMAALMVEVINSLDKRRSSRPKSRKPSLVPNTGGGTNDSQNKLMPPFTLSQLLHVNVILRSETVPSIRNFIAQSPKEHEFSKTLSGILNVEAGNLDETAESQTIMESNPNEVTLTLRDVLNLIILVNSIEDEVAAAASSSSSSSFQ